MKKAAMFVGLLAACAAVAGCSKKEAAPSPDRDAVTQVSLLGDFKRGAYEGRASVGEMMHYGRFGIGAFDALDGEMLVLDGRVFRFAANGDASEVAPSYTTPSATMTFFDTDMTFDVGALDDVVFHKTMDWKRPRGVQIVAFRVTGLFDVVKTRSVPRQAPPFRPLDEVGASTVQSEWREVAGTIAGFYFADAWKDLNWPGYHLHFIDRDRKHGGHVLSFRLRQGRIEVDACASAQLLSRLGTNVSLTALSP
jgi:acetolactate decarboxylase